MSGSLGFDPVLRPAGPTGFFPGGKCSPRQWPRGPPPGPAPDVFPVPSYSGSQRPHGWFPRPCDARFLLRRSCVPILQSIRRGGDKSDADSELPLPCITHSNAHAIHADFAHAHGAYARWGRLYCYSGPTQKFRISASSCWSWPASFPTNNGFPDNGSAPTSTSAITALRPPKSSLLCFLLVTRHGAAAHRTAAIASGGPAQTGTAAPFTISTNHCNYHHPPETSNA